MDFIFCNFSKEFSALSFRSQDRLLGRKQPMKEWEAIANISLHLVWSGFGESFVLFASLFPRRVIAVRCLSLMPLL